MEQEYRKDLSHLTWEKVYNRQVQRASLVEDWLSALQVVPGKQILDVGAGPGYVSLRAAELVGPDGVVYAVDRSAEALAYLERLHTENGVTQIRRIVADAGALNALDLHPDAALVTMMLHHADDPAGILRSTAACLPVGGRAVVAEYHPEGPGVQGPPLAHRIAPEAAQAWCEQAGFSLIEYRRQTPEHYMLVLQRQS